MSLQPINTNSVDSDGVYTKLQKYSFQIGELVLQAKRFHIQGRQDVNRALTFAVEARQLGKRIESIKKEITEPARKFVSSINDTAKSFTEKLEEIEDFMMSKIDEWKELMRDKQEVYNLLEAEVILENTEVLRHEGATAYEKVQYKFEVLDIEKVPSHYLRVDEKQVDLMLKAGVMNIPGLKVWSEKKTILKSR